jgi:hypothetical protein
LILKFYFFSSHFCLFVVLVFLIFVFLCFVFTSLLTCMMMWSSCIPLFLHSYSYFFIHNSYFYLLCVYFSLSIPTFHFQLINFVLLLPTLYSYDLLFFSLHFQFLFFAPNYAFSYFILNLLFLPFIFGLFSSSCSLFYSFILVSSLTRLFGSSPSPLGKSKNTHLPIQASLHSLVSFYFSLCILFYLLSVFLS